MTQAKRFRAWDTLAVEEREFQRISRKRTEDG